MGWGGADGGPAPPGLCYGGGGDADRGTMVAELARLTGPWERMRDRLILADARPATWPYPLGLSPRAYARCSLMAWKARRKVPFFT
jgi:hypothetical protein